MQILEEGDFRDQRRRQETWTYLGRWGVGGEGGRVLEGERGRGGGGGTGRNGQDPPSRLSLSLRNSSTHLVPPLHPQGATIGSSSVSEASVHT